MTLFGDVPRILDDLVKQTEAQRKRVDTVERDMKMLYDPQGLEEDSILRVTQLEQTIKKLNDRVLEQDKAFSFVTNEFYALKKESEARIASLERIAVSRVATQQRSPSPRPPPRKRSPSPLKRSPSPIRHRRVREYEEEHQDPSCMVHVSSTTSEHTDSWFKDMRCFPFKGVKSTVIKTTGWAFVIFDTPEQAKQCLLDSAHDWAKEHGLRFSQYYGKKQRR